MNGERQSSGRHGERHGISKNKENDMKRNIRKENPLTERKLRQKAKENNALKKADQESTGLFSKVPTIAKKKYSSPFVWCLGFSALVVASCAAFFSVRGIGLLFSGSMIAVVIMAAGLEFGKLVAASYLYRYWSKTSKLLKFYLFSAVITLVGITSLGIYGFLSDAFEKTRTQVGLYESNIAMLESENNALNNQISSAENSVSDFSEKADDAIASYKRIYDDFVIQQNKRRDSFVIRLDKMDSAVQALEDEPGGLFSNKKRKLQELKDSQAEERSSINNSIEGIDSAISSEYQEFLDKVKGYRSRSESAVDTLDISSFREKIENNNKEILNNKELIAKTDIGSFKFISEAFQVPLDDVVKWFILCIVIVFDPLSVTLVIAYNVALKNEEDS